MLCTQPAESGETLAELFLRVMDNNAVVHIPLVELHAERVLNIVVDAIRKRDRGYLRDLTSEAEPLVAEALNKILRERDEPLVDAAALDSSEHGRVLRGVKVF